MSNFGADRYDIKTAAGWSRVRRDGSDYSRVTDELSAAAEDFVARIFGVEPDRSALLSGDPGYDLAVPGIGLIDVIHAGVWPDGRVRHGPTSNVIINIGSKKLTGSNFLVYVHGDHTSLAVVGWCPMPLFVAHATRRNFGFGDKWAVPATMLSQAPLSDMAATPTRRPLTDEAFAEALREVGRVAFGIRYDAPRS